MDGVLHLPSEGVFFVLAAAFVRVGATLQSMVIFSTGAVPVQVRVGLAGTIAVLAAGVVPPPPEVGWDAAALAVALGGEVLLGLFLGISTRLLFGFIELTGTLVGLNAGTHRLMLQLVDVQHENRVLGTSPRRSFRIFVPTPEGSSVPGCADLPDPQVWVPWCASKVPLHFLPVMVGRMVTS